MRNRFIPQEKIMPQIKGQYKMWMKEMNKKRDLMKVIKFWEKYLGLEVEIQRWNWRRDIGEENAEDEK